MKICKIFIIFIFTISSQLLFGQETNRFLDNYYFYKNQPVKKTSEYKDIEGSPYLNDEFVEGIIFLKDTSAFKLPLRYNIYADEMEYQLKGINYVVGNPKFINTILLGESVFVYLPFIQKSGYFELFESGKCFLVQKKLVEYKPAEGPKPIEGAIAPAKFVRQHDVFYLIINGSQTTKIINMKSVLNALQDQKLKIKNFIKQEKIKQIKKENLIKIVKYYNNL